MAHLLKFLGVKLRFPLSTFTGCLEWRPDLLHIDLFLRKSHCVCSEPALGEAAVEPAQNQSGSRQNRRAVRVAIPFTDDHAGGMETLFSDPTLGEAQVYSIASPGIRNQQILLTYARCECPLLSALEQIQCHKPTNGTRGVVESHKDGTSHVHIYVQKSICRGNK